MIQPVRIQRGDLVCGVDAVRLRNSLRRVRYQEFSSVYLGELLGLDDTRTAVLVADLVHDGYIQAAHADHYCTTLHGNTLANASAAKPIRREVGLRNLRDLIGRAREVNENSDYLYQVERLVLFGSLLTETPLISDVDVAVELGRREVDRARHNELSRARSRQAAAAGRRFANLVDDLSWPETEVWRHLKGRSTALSLTAANDLVLEHAPSLIVYDRSEGVALDGDPSAAITRPD